MRRLLVTGGGTGGHIYPALALAQEFLARGEGRSLLFIGTRRGLEARIIPQAGLPFVGLPIRGWRGKGAMERARFLPELAGAFALACRSLRRFRPEALLATGSFASLPALLAARFMGCPYFLQEQNSVPGQVVRLMAPGARGLFLAYEEASRRLPKRAAHHLTGNPLRGDFVARARRRHDQQPAARRRLLVFGGSRGAHRINEAAAAALPLLAAEFEFEAIVQTGEEDYERTAAALASLAPAIRVRPYLENIPEEMEQCHGVVCRAGAMTLAEITAMGLPAVLIPYPFAVDDHQTRNARALEEAGAAVLIPDAELSGERLHACLAELWSRPEKEAGMSAASAALGRLDATGAILDILEKSLAAPQGR